MMTTAAHLQTAADRYATYYAANDGVIAIPRRRSSHVPRRNTGTSSLRGSAFGGPRTETGGPSRRSMDEGTVALGIKDILSQAAAATGAQELPSRQAQQLPQVPSGDELPQHTIDIPPAARSSGDAALETEAGSKMDTTGEIWVAGYGEHCEGSARTYLQLRFSAGCVHKGTLGSSAGFSA